MDKKILSKTFKKSEKFIHRRNPDESIILMKITDEDDFFKITGVASEIWNQIDGQKSVEKIMDSILSDYEVSKDQLLSDSIPFINKLLSLEIIEEQ